MEIDEIDIYDEHKNLRFDQALLLSDQFPAYRVYFLTFFMHVLLFFVFSFMRAPSS